MAEDQLTEFARLFKQRDNKPPGSMTTGIVMSPPPEAEIHLNDGTFLFNRHLIWSAHMLEKYQRELELEGQIKFADSNCGTTESGGAVISIGIDTSYEAKNVKITMKDTIKKGEEVIIMPVVDNQLYYVIDKAVRFE
ncbi:DUF2577 family protein [Psychrobacillus sp. NPDC093180]|uniref:DUF2577 family protein n=1 Tax=Psychrobacillus sp. NPDC093180 TaxID=3364489 RepID=UPI00382B1329